MQLKPTGVERTIFYRVGRPLRAKTAWLIANADKTGITPERPMHS
jgi:hypothetical protein